MGTPITLQWYVMQKRETHPEKQHVVGIVLLIFVFTFVVLADDTFELLDYLNDGGDVWTFIGVFFGIGTAVLIIGQYVLPEYRIYLFPLSFLLLFFSIYFLFFELFSIFIELDYSNYMVGLIAIIFLIISIIFLLEFLIRTFKTILIKFPRKERMIIENFEKLTG